MFTQIVTFLIIVAIIGSIMYGQKLIRTEKIDAVFGNPERAKGGTHWIIVGSSVILLTWLYYSWDIAKSFYPQSANELCQVGKVNDSLLSLKYLFPIEEREFKSTSIIKAENKNIAKLKNEILNAKISEQHRSILVGLIDKTKSTIPLLTNENLLENQTKIKIADLADKIDQLSSEFEKKDYPSMLITTSLFDNRVLYSEPVKYIAKLRDLKTDNNTQLLKCKMEAAGHGGMSGRDNAITELAEEYSFILKTAKI